MATRYLDDTNPDRAETLIEKAVDDLGTLSRIGEDQYRPLE